MDKRDHKFMDSKYLLSGFTKNIVAHYYQTMKGNLSYHRFYIWQKLACSVYYSYLRQAIHGRVTYTEVYKDRDLMFSIYLQGPMSSTCFIALTNEYRWQRSEYLEICNAVFLFPYDVMSRLEIWHWQMYVQFVWLCSLKGQGQGQRNCNRYTSGI